MPTKERHEPAKAPGRPSSPDPMVPISVSIRQSEYDKLCQLAHKRDEKLSAVVRSLLMLRLP